MSGGGRGHDNGEGLAFRMAVRASCLKHKKYRVWDKEFILAIDKVRGKSMSLVMQTSRGEFTVDIGEGYHSGKGKPYRVLFLDSIIRGMDLLEKDQLIAYKGDKPHTVRVEIHRDPCLECGQPGEVVICDNCSGSYHLSCCGLSAPPRDGFTCSRCRGPSTKSRRTAHAALPTELASDDEQTRLNTANARATPEDDDEDFQRMHTLLQAAEQLDDIPGERGAQPPMIVPKTGEVLVACGPRSNPEHWMYASFHVHNCKIRYLVWDESRGWTEKLISPAEFERQAGRASSKKWRESIWVLGRDGHTPECNIGKYLDSIGKPRSNLPQPVGMGGHSNPALSGGTSDQLPASGGATARRSHSPEASTRQDAADGVQSWPKARSASLPNLHTQSSRSRRTSLHPDGREFRSTTGAATAAMKRKAASYGSIPAAVPVAKHSRSVLSRAAAMDSPRRSAPAADEDMSEASHSSTDDRGTPRSTTAGSQLHFAAGVSMDDDGDEDAPGAQPAAAGGHAGQTLAPGCSVDIHPGIFRRVHSSSRLSKGGDAAKELSMEEGPCPEGSGGPSSDTAAGPATSQAAAKVANGNLDATSCPAGAPACTADPGEVRHMDVDETALGEDIKKHLARQLASTQRAGLLETQLEQAQQRAVAAEAAASELRQENASLRQQLAHTVADMQQQAKQLQEQTMQLAVLQARLEDHQAQWAVERCSLQDAMRLAEGKYSKAMQELLDIKNMLRENVAGPATKDGMAGTGTA